MGSPNGIVSLLIGLPLGTLLGGLGSLTGIGGGFLLMPALLWLFPSQSPGALSVATMTVVFFNALSGTILSARQDRVRFRTGLTYGVLSLPLVWVGTHLQSQVDRGFFQAAFGVFLLAGATFLLLRPKSPGTVPRTSRRIWVAGAGLSLIIGFVSGFFGVGGGFLFVPLLAFFLGFPLSEATATSQLIVGMGAAWALVTGASVHPLPLDPMLLSGLVAGVLLGAPLGTQAAGRWSPPVVLRILAGLLALVGAKFLLP
jgi:uncharacterized membrane protein YfcA